MVYTFAFNELNSREEEDGDVHTESGISYAQDLQQSVSQISIT